MEFKAGSTTPPPKNLYPCLATINITPTPVDRSRRFSGASQEPDDGNALRRVISGNRRKTSFGEAVVSTSADERRKSIEASKLSGGSAAGGKDEVTGRWFWRVQAGTNDTHLILLPLSQPPNPLLTVAPQPLSQAMPAHSATASKAKTSMPGGANEGHNRKANADADESLTTKFKNLFKKGSPKSDPQALPQDHVDTEPPGAHDSAEISHGASGTCDASSNVYSMTSTAVDDRILDQNGRGQQMPTAEANQLGATNANANAETEWPGMIKGDRLGAVVVDLRSVDKSKVVLGGGKKGEGSWVTVPINSHFLTLVHPMLEPIGKSHHDFPKSGSIRFDFDKDWIGAKGYVRLCQGSQLGQN
ncbi:hypothetical protein BD324DRAFT_621513 [Kockovaella imperatae]|uniref:Uncharacterized protein n=1 Tax=Kockovaella imperatae TaxID=4999 RepID=A0A1Y1UKU0_9TREE|nr:hypothetical protein BD324DRAFT_621513 [Kockovaella imperatae]ORX38592.1 hypothetical protein BD324DRAFT_621513 [Kockovaella imperatae]